MGSWEIETTHTDTTTPRPIPTLPDFPYFECLSTYTQEERVKICHASKNDLIIRGSENTLFLPVEVWLAGITKFL